MVILADASSATLARFNKLFQGSMDAGKAFKGRMGNLATRARTIETAVAIDRAGLKVAFEHQIDVGNGASRFVDVAALDAARQPVQFYQLYKATNIRPTMIRTGP